MQELSDYHLTSDPIHNFTLWLNEAEKKNIDNFNAFTLSTIDEHGHPDSRIVLYKGLYKNQICFYTCYSSPKAMQMEKTSFVSGVFYWRELKKQIRFKGKISKLTKEQNDAYFNSRAKESQLAAVVSDQSHPIKNKQTLMEKYQDLKNSFKDKEVSRPANWGGYSIDLQELEFFLHDSNRLNDRFHFSLEENNKWKAQRLQP